MRCERGTCFVLSPSHTCWIELWPNGCWPEVDRCEATRTHTHIHTHAHTHAHTRKQTHTLLYCTPLCRTTKPPAPQKPIYLPWGEAGVSLSLWTTHLCQHLSNNTLINQWKRRWRCCFVVGRGWMGILHSLAAAATSQRRGSPPPSCWGWCFHVLWETMAWVERIEQQTYVCN